MYYELKYALLMQIEQPLNVSTYSSLKMENFSAKIISHVHQMTFSEFEKRIAE